MTQKIEDKELFKPHAYPEIPTFNKNWAEYEITQEDEQGNKIKAKPREGIVEFLNSVNQVAYKLYADIVAFQDSCTLDNASIAFTESLGKYLEFMSILENTEIKADIIKSLNQAYSYAGSTFTIVKLAKIIFGPTVDISFFLDETPKRVVFSSLTGKNIVPMLFLPDFVPILTPQLLPLLLPQSIFVSNAKHNALLCTPKRLNLITPDGRRIIAKNAKILPETIPVLKAFFSKFTMANYATIFEFDI
jgi:hypothetical protein